MKKIVAGLAIAAMCISVAACGGSSTSSPEATTQPVAEATTTAVSEEVGVTGESVSDFIQASAEEVNSLPELQQLGTAMGTTAGSVGVTKMDLNDNTKWEFGNYRNDSVEGIENYTLTCRANTPTGRKLDFLASYVKAQNPYGSTKTDHWTIASIKNADNGHLYYVAEGATGQYDIYDYQTDQLRDATSGSTEATEATVATTEAQQATTEKKEEAEIYKAVEKAEEFSPKVTFTENMANDVTGRWRLAEIDENIDIQDYAISYYKTYFEDPAEVHIIINYSRNVTTCMTAYGNLLFVDLYDMVLPADTDAKDSLSGTPLASYKIDLKTGKIEKIE